MMLEHELEHYRYSCKKTILLHLKQHTFQQQTTWMYRYLKLDPTFKQTKRVLGTLRKLPGPKQYKMSRFILADKYVKYFYFKH